MSSLLFLLGTGCASSGVIPESLESGIDKDVTFEQVVEAPDAYRGRTFVVGGEVLRAKRITEGTQLEILQLPLDSDQRPVTRRTESRGRLIASKQDFLDPATLPEGTQVTMVAEVMGATTDRLDEAEYRYPTVAIKHLHVWKEPREDYPRNAGPWWGVFGGVGIGGGGRSGGGVSIGTGF